MNRVEEVLATLNNTGLGQQLATLQRAILFNASKSLIGNSTGTNLDGPDAPDPVEDREQYDRMILNTVGPAAASAAVDYAIKKCQSRGKLKECKFNGSFIHNVHIIQNDAVEEMPAFSNVLREFLLPRYAYLDFDRLIDPRHNIDFECGYPKFITPIMYRYMYDRDDMARRVVDIYPDESWAIEPEVWETDNEKEETEFEGAWKELCYEHNIMSYLYRMDRLSGIGHYGALLFGINDGEDMEKPIVGVRSDGVYDPRVAKLGRRLLYMRPFDEYLSFIHMYETDQLNRRYGLPKFYNLVFLDMTIDAAGASIGTRLNRRVHWSRVLHVADNLQSSLVFGIPRMQTVFNRLLDLRKIKGGSAEMFWKGAFPGISFEIDPRFVSDEPEFDKDKFREEIEKYANGLQRYLSLVGVSAKSLAPQVADPSKHVAVQTKAIATMAGIPLRILEGTESGRMASAQDGLAWNKRLGRRIRRFVEPSIVRAFIDRLIMIGILPMPKTGKYYISWPDLNSATDEDKANLGLKWTQALAQYVSSGVIHLIGPMDYLTMILGLKPSDAAKIIATVEAKGGFAKLQKVDPSQGSGVNGKAENNVSKGDRTGTAASRPRKRNKADKQAEGKTS